MKNKLNSKVFKAVILGHAIGDALGVPVEFLTRDELDKNPVTDMHGYGTYPVPAGCWSDDTSMTLATLDSLSDGRINPDGIMENFGRWYYHNEFTPTGEMFDVGNTCSFAIDNYFSKHLDVAHCGLSGEHDNGNGSLMRIIPVVLYTYATHGCTSYGKLWKNTASVSLLTHSHYRSVLGCMLYATVLAELISRPDISSVDRAIQVFSRWNSDADDFVYYERITSHRLKALPRDEIKSSGYVVDTIEAALWCLYNSSSYKECVLAAVNLGDDTDTVAAVAGGLAGALYGLEAIPQKWLETLKKRDMIEKMCDEALRRWNEIKKGNK